VFFPQMAMGSKGNKMTAGKHPIGRTNLNNYRDRQFSYTPPPSHREVAKVGPRPIFREPTPPPKPHVNPFRDAEYLASVASKKSANWRVHGATHEKPTSMQIAASRAGQDPQKNADAYKVNVRNLQPRKKNLARAKKLYAKKDIPKRRPKQQ